MEPGLQIEFVFDSFYSLLYPESNVPSLITLFTDHTVSELIGVKWRKTKNRFCCL